MADKFSLDLEQRTVTGKKVNRLRRDGILPATVYGKGVGPYTVQMNERTFTDLLRKAGRTSLVELSIPGVGKQSAFIHALQIHPVRRNVLHVDFRVVDLRVEINVDVPVHPVGESEMVKRGEAVLNQLHTTVSLHALPADIPHAIEVDVSVLDSLDKNILGSDLVLPEGVSLVTAADEVIFSVTPPTAEEPEETAEEATEGEEAAETTEEAATEDSDDE